MSKELLVCLNCKAAIFSESAANTAPRWSGKITDPPEKREEISGQNDLIDFKEAHQKHEVIEASLLHD